MTKKELEQLQFLDKELKMWQQKLSEIDRNTVQSPNWATPPSGSNQISNKTASRAENIVEINEIIADIAEKVDQQKLAILNYIQSIDDSMMRQVVVHRHIDTLSWQQIASKMQYSDGDAIRKKYERFLKQ